MKRIVLLGLLLVNLHAKEDIKKSENLIISDKSKNMLTDYILELVNAIDVKEADQKEISLFIEVMHNNNYIFLDELEKQIAISKDVKFGNRKFFLDLILVLKAKK